MLLIAPPSSYRIAAYLDAASSLDVDLVVASQGEHSLIPEIANGLRIDLDAPDEALARIVAVCERESVHGVVSTDDATGELAARAADALGLSHNPPGAARIARRKDLARDAMASAGLPVPRYATVRLDRPLHGQTAGVRYPCVVKPLAMAGSRGVIRADSARELEAACRRVASIVAECTDPQERHTVLVEDFIPGEEIAVEGILTGGELRVLAVFDKPEPLNGPYFEESYYVTPTRLLPDAQSLVEARISQACAAYGLRQGPIHAELRLHEGEAWILEIAARTIGGDCARLLSYGTGRALEALVLENALARPMAIGELAGAAGVLMIPIPRAGTLRRVEGVLAARAVPGVRDVAILVREGYELVPLPEGGSYLGFVFAVGDDARAVEAALREAHACLNVVVAPAWRLEPVGGSPR